jgi:hypothetical protein
MTMSEANYWAKEFSDEQLDAEADNGLLLLVAEKILSFLSDEPINEDAWQGDDREWNSY